jgi:hypothetical protein
MNDTRTVVDGAIAAGAITLPWWIVHLSGWVSFFTVLGGLILVCFRIVIAYRELKIKDPKQDQ